MEVGNALFGISRGEFPIEREEGFEEELFRLFDVIAPDDSNSWRVYGMDFENDVFSVFPCYWGDCTCGFDQKDAQWQEENHHDENCPIVKPNFHYKPTGFSINWYKYPL
ncbi:MAG: hypothetical protein KPEEDBHJ_00601 [Anaerolineales bacterium]|nr:hypothetical protein [Anaerolineales bacterium]